MKSFPLAHSFFRADSQEEDFRLFTFCTKKREVFREKLSSANNLFIFLYLKILLLKNKLKSLPSRQRSIFSLKASSQDEMRRRNFEMMLKNNDKGERLVRLRNSSSRRKLNIVI